MAKKLKGFDFTVGGNGGAGRYPWDTWLSGDVWCLESGVDFTTDISNFRNQIHATSRSRGLRVRTRIQGKNIIIRAYKP